MQKLLFATGLIILGVVSKANAATITVFNTGVNDDNTLLPLGSVDPHYSLVSAPNNSTNAVVTTTYSKYVPNNSISQWIGSTVFDGSSHAALGTYIYETNFDLTGFDASTAKLSGFLGSDDGGSLQVLLNGVQTNLNASFVHLTQFSIDNGFVDGTNTMTFIVENVLGSTALRVEFTEATAKPVPEPLTIFGSVTALGFGALLKREHSKKHKKADCRRV